MKILVMAGGTGGHVFPAIAVAHELKSRGHQVTWMGAPDSFESRVVPQYGVPMEFIRISGLRGKGLFKWVLAPLILARATFQALRIQRRLKPDVALGMGGFASGPGGFASWLLQIPLCIHEQNAVAGLTNRLLACLSCAVLQAFPGVFSKGHTVGNPVREDLNRVPAPEARLAGRSGPLRVLVVGGSQGARALNQKVPAAVGLLAEGQRPELWHQAGRTLDTAKDAYGRAGVEARIESFIEDMAGAYTWSDLVICRSGASTVAELAAAGCAAVLVPFPAAVDDHQTRNGEFLVRGGGAVVVQERDLSAERLSSMLLELAANRDRLLQMAQASRSLARPGAVKGIADCLVRLGAAK